MKIWKFAVLMVTALALLAGCNKKRQGHKCRRLLETG